MKKIIFLSFVICCVLFTENNLSAQCCSFTYQQQVEPPTSAATFGVALGDFDNDGDQDAVAISAYYGIDVYFNNGAGVFTLNAQYATGSNPDFYGVHVVDVDNDGDKDIIAIPFYTTSSLTILKNNGSGVFTVTSFASNIATYNAAVGDIDGDGDVDIFLPNAGGGSGKVAKNNGTGSFSLYQTLANARGHDAALGDLDGDGDLDAFVTENSTYGNTVFLNDGTGFFTQLGTNFSTDGGEVALGDIDSDGDLDAVVGNAGNTIEIWLNNGSGVFTAGPVITVDPTWGYCKTIILKDNDADGDLDMFLGFYSHSPQVWINNGGLSFSLCYDAPTNAGTYSHGMAVGDLNNDGKLDIYSGYFSNDDGDYVFLSGGTVTASILYKNSPYCNEISIPQTVTQSGATGGAFSAVPSGLTINNTNGSITPSTSTPGNYTVTYMVGGCSFTATLTISSLDLTTTINGSTITANQSGAVYKWINCNNANQIIAGQTAQSFTPSLAGSYAAIITNGGCHDTTACANILTVGIPENTLARKLKIYPNPVSDELTIENFGSIEIVEFEIFNSIGTLVYKGKLTDKTSVRTSNFSAGIYLIKLENSNYVEFRKIVKE